MFGTKEKDLRDRLHEANIVNDGLIRDLGKIYLRARKLKSALQNQNPEDLGIAGQAARTAQIELLDQVFESL